MFARNKTAIFRTHGATMGRMAARLSQSPLRITSRGRPERNFVVPLYFAASFPPGAGAGARSRSHQRLEARCRRDDRPELMSLVAADGRQPRARNPARALSPAAVQDLVAGTRVTISAVLRAPQAHDHPAVSALANLDDAPGRRERFGRVRRRDRRVLDSGRGTHGELPGGAGGGIISAATPYAQRGLGSGGSA